jgi:hypothetical protein
MRLKLGVFSLLGGGYTWSGTTEGEGRVMIEENKRGLFTSSRLVAIVVPICCVGWVIHGSTSIAQASDKVVCGILGMR